MADTTTLDDRLPYMFPAVHGDSEFSTWLREHQNELDGFVTDTGDVQQGLQLAHAEGLELDLLGADYGVLGKRRGRSDPRYRSFLLGLVSAYKGRGTPPGVKLAVALGVGATQADIGLEEDFTNNEYEVHLYDWQAHLTSAVHELANISDPSVIQRRDPLHYHIGTAPMAVVGSLGTNTGSNVGTATVTAGAAAGARTISTQGLSASELDPLSTGGGWNLSETT